MRTDIAQRSGNSPPPIDTHIMMWTAILLAGR